MNEALSPPEIERFRDAILRSLGLQFDDSKLGQLGEVLRRRLAKRDAPGPLYLAELESNPPPEECVALAEELTVTETYFLRNRDQFDALAGMVLPERLARHGEPRTLRLLSAGCASGEEPYSLAIVAAEILRDGWDVAVRAVDLNPAALAKARRARYSDWALRDTPEEVRRRWFTRDGTAWVVVPEARRRVTFETVNLADPGHDLWRCGSYDVVFCRNVLMYFSPEQRRAAIDRLTRALMPGGYLFLGHAESLSGVSDAFHLRHTHEAFYYQRKDEAGRAVRPWPVAPAPRPFRPGTLLDSAWSETIRAASERVTALLPEPPPPAPPARGNDLAPALELLRRERFAEALDHVGAQPDPADPGALLLSAVLQQQSGRLADAETICKHLLAIDDLSAGAHYVLALCRENAGDLDAAAEHDRVAAYLDPAFAMPRLHLGLLTRRRGDREAARRELAQALILLEGESTARLLMFGGGFNRAALVALCRAALRDCGGKS